jgi:hypothetical protein
MLNEKLLKFLEQHEQKIESLSLEKSKNNPHKFAYVEMMDIIESFPFNFMIHLSTNLLEHIKKLNKEKIN